MLAKAKCDVTVEFADGAVNVLGVKSELSIALLNIAKNALEAIDKESGRIELSVKQLGVLVEFRWHLEVG